MESHLELRKSLTGQRALGISGKTVLPQASQRSNIQDRYGPEKPNLSYADLHREITKDVKVMSPESLGNHPKQQIYEKVSKEDELVKYMSKLPSYLERGENLQEKVLNVGVLDWGRLEKWQYCHKQIPQRNSRSSVSSSYTSSSLSTDESCSHSSRGDSCSPAHQMPHRPSLQFHLMSSPLQSDPQAVKVFGRTVGKFQDPKATQRNNSKEQGNFIKTDEPFSQNHSEIKLEQCRRKDSDLKIDPESGTVPNGVNREGALHRKIKMKTPDEYTKRAEKLEEKRQNYHDQKAHENQNTVVLLLPRDLPQNHLSKVPKLPDSTEMLGQRAEKAVRRSIVEQSKELRHAELSSEFLGSCPLPHEFDGSRRLHMKHASCVDAEISCIPSERSQSVPRSSKTGISPFRGRNVEDKRSTIMPTKFNSSDLSNRPDLKLSKVAPEKGRSISPFRRFSFSTGKTSKTSSSKDSLALPQLSSRHISVKSDSENVLASSCIDNTSCDKPNATSRARSSPLRRLLEPLMKPKAVNCRNFDEPLQTESRSSDKARRLSDGQLSCSTEQSRKVKLDMTGCRAVNVSYSSRDEKHGSSTVQALLRVAIKNGQPLFTLAVDNESDILAGTLKKLCTSGKDDYSCIYTFFTFREVKKKNGRWIKPGPKGQGLDYISNVVAQVRVSGSQPSNMVRRNCMDQFSIREFVLFAVDLGQGDQQASDYQPNDELAAIVVKIPKRINRSSLRDAHQNDKCNDFQEVGLKEYLAEERSNSNSGRYVHNWPPVCNQDVSATVILPSGVHSLPHKGGPSSLIQRWKSGGSCDCGGWDVGCKLRVLANQNQLSKKSSSLRSSFIGDRFELFFEGGAQDNQPFFSFAPFEDGIYSIEFNSSLSLLQAFAICIAIWDGRKQCELSELSNSVEEKTWGRTTLVENGVRTSTQLEGDIPARYVSYPPLSPVGRV